MMQKVPSWLRGSRRRVRQSLALVKSRVSLSVTTTRRRRPNVDKTAAAESNGQHGGAVAVASTRDEAPPDAAEAEAQLTPAEAEVTPAEAEVTPPR